MPPGDGPTRVFLVRHGKTTEPGRFHGAESDVGLSARGLEQAKLLARHLAGLGLAAVHSSGLRRALDTAAPIAIACGLELATSDALRECRMGSLSGRRKDEAGAEYDGLIQRWTNGDLDFKLEGGESYRDVARRILEPFQDLSAHRTGGAIAVVTHGIVIRVLLTSLVEGLGPSDFQGIRVRTGSFADLRRDGARWTAADLDVRPPRES